MGKEQVADGKRGRVMTKTYTLPDGKKVVFEYNHNRVGTITLECMDALMALLKATAEQTEPSGYKMKPIEQTEPSTDCSWK